MYILSQHIPFVFITILLCLLANHNFWTIEYYQKYFDVRTSEVVERIISSVLPQKVSRNYFDERIKGKPDLYGPIWISVTLV